MTVIKRATGVDSGGSCGYMGDLTFRDSREQMVRSGQDDRQRCRQFENGIFALKQMSPGNRSR